MRNTIAAKLVDDAYMWIFKHNVMLEDITKMLMEGNTRAGTDVSVHIDEYMDFLTRLKREGITPVSTDRFHVSCDADVVLAGNITVEKFAFPGYDTVLINKRFRTLLSDFTAELAKHKLFMVCKFGFAMLPKWRNRYYVPHFDGNAIDFTIAGGTLQEAYEIAREFLPKHKVPSKVILSPRFIHLEATRRARSRRVSKYDYENCYHKSYGKPLPQSDVRI